VRPIDISRKHEDGIKMTKTYIFDLETKHLAQEVGGWDYIDRLGLAAAVLLDVDADTVLRYTEQQAAELVDTIEHADRVIGFNLIRFDYTVLKPYGLSTTPELVSKTTDLLLDIYQELGFRVSLDNLAATSFQAGKSADGLQAVAWYKEGKIDEVLAYCEIDVAVTKDLWQFGKEHGRVFFQDRFGRRRAVNVDWS
jgi:DEAD/DEAH box helicase domain-containing protein